MPYGVNSMVCRNFCVHCKKKWQHTQNAEPFLLFSLCVCAQVSNDNHRGHDEKRLGSDRTSGACSYAPCCCLDFATTNWHHTANTTHRSQHHHVSPTHFLNLIFQQRVGITHLPPTQDWQHILQWGKVCPGVVGSRRMGRTASQNEWCQGALLWAGLLQNCRYVSKKNNTLSFNLENKFKKKKELVPAGFEPATYCVWGRRATATPWNLLFYPLFYY